MGRQGFNGNQLEDGAYQIIVSPKVATGDTQATVTTAIFGKVTGVASDENGIYIGLGDAVTAGLGDIITMRNDDYFDKINKPDNGDDNDSSGGNGGNGDSSDGEQTNPAA